MKTIYLVRHGQTDGNVNRCFQPTDIPLSENGERQAEFIAERCSHLDAEVILTSPYQRAQQTATAIQKVTGLPKREETILHERVMPTVLLGKPMDAPESCLVLEELDRCFTVPGKHHSDEENLEDLQIRARTILEMFEQQPEERLVVVSHGFILLMILMETLDTGLPPEDYLRLRKKFQLENTALSKLEFDPERGWRPIIWNDHAHLG